MRNKAFWWAGCVIALLTASMVVVACGGDDDDDDDGSSSGSADCTVDDLCQWAVDTCGMYSDVSVCTDVAGECDDEGSAVACLCDCMTADTGCTDSYTGTCAAQCFIKYC